MRFVGQWRADARYPLNEVMPIRSVLPTATREHRQLPRDPKYPSDSTIHRHYDPNVNEFLEGYLAMCRLAARVYCPEKHGCGRKRLKLKKGKS